MFLVGFQAGARDCHPTPSWQEKLDLAEAAGVERRLRAELRRLATRRAAVPPIFVCFFPCLLCFVPLVCRFVCLRLPDIDTQGRKEGVE